MMFFKIDMQGFIIINWLSFESDQQLFGLGIYKKNNGLFLIVLKIKEDSFQW